MRNGEVPTPNRGISLFGMQAQINIWTGMVSLCVWWQIALFEAVHFDGLVCWLYHLWILGVSDTPSEGVALHMRTPLPQALRLQAQACSLFTGTLPRPGLTVPRRLSWTTAFNFSTLFLSNFLSHAIFVYISVTSQKVRILCTTELTIFLIHNEFFLHFSFMVRLHTFGLRGKAKGQLKVWKFGLLTKLK